MPLGLQQINCATKDQVKRKKGHMKKRQINLLSQKKMNFVTEIQLKVIYI